MAILWCGGEDIDFPAVPGGATTLAASAGDFRAGYSRLSLFIASAIDAAHIAQSLPFTGGAVTSAWFSMRWSPGGTANRAIAGVFLSGTTKGLIVGSDTSSGTKLALSTLNGTTRTQLAAESATSLTNGVICKLDMQVINYGASATVRVYVNGLLLITFTGDTRVTGMTNFDCCAIAGTTGGTSTSFLSEFIVADVDTRTLSLVTLAPTGAGFLDQWTGAYTDVNETTINDATAINTNTVTQDEQFTVTALPAGTFTCRGVKIAARAMGTAGATATQVGLGVRSGGTVDAGTPQAVTPTFTTYERLMTVNPVTGVAWTQADLGAVQQNYRSS